MTLTADRQTLLDARPTLDPTGRLNWRANLGITQWAGVRVENERVALIRLGPINLGGRIPPELGQLDALEHLAIMSNNLTGRIPPELGKLSNDGQHSAGTHRPSAPGHSHSRDRHHTPPDLISATAEAGPGSPPDAKPPRPEGRDGSNAHTCHPNVRVRLFRI